MRPIVAVVSIPPRLQNHVCIVMHLEFPFHPLLNCQVLGTSAVFVRLIFSLVINQICHEFALNKE